MRNGRIHPGDEIIIALRASTIAGSLLWVLPDADVIGALVRAPARQPPFLRDFWPAQKIVDDVRSFGLKVTIQNVEASALYARAHDLARIAKGATQLDG